MRARRAELSVTAAQMCFFSRPEWVDKGASGAPQFSPEDTQPKVACASPETIEQFTPKAA